MKTNFNKIFLFALLGICLAEPVYAQTPASDSSYHPYYVNYWVTGAISAVGLFQNYLGIPNIIHKTEVTPAELSALNKDIINYFDKWALTQDPSLMEKNQDISNFTLTATIVLPVFLLFDTQIRHDWLDIVLMYTEATYISANVFSYSFLGPPFQNRFRPITYYEQLSETERKSGNNRNSFYSGHVASAAVASFFMVKVYSDYNPQIGDYKYLLYGAAAIPPLLVGYFRIKALQHFPSDVMIGLGVGALCGIIIPEFHHIKDKNIKLGLYSTPESTGITVNWQPDFLK